MTFIQGSLTNGRPIYLKQLLYLHRSQTSLLKRHYFCCISPRCRKTLRMICMLIMCMYTGRWYFREKQMINNWKPQYFYIWWVCRIQDVNLLCIFSLLWLLYLRLFKYNQFYLKLLTNNLFHAFIISLVPNLLDCHLLNILKWNKLLT